MVLVVSSHVIIQWPPWVGINGSYGGFVGWALTCMVMSNNFMQQWPHYWYVSRQSEPVYKTRSAPRLAFSEIFEGSSHTARELTLISRTTEECLYVSVPIEELWLEARLTSEGVFTPALLSQTLARWPRKSGLLGEVWTSNRTLMHTWMPSGPEATPRAGSKLQCILGKYKKEVGSCRESFSEVFGPFSSVVLSATSPQEK